ncbi:MAG TPA: hypothetical protein VMV69_03295 [Pirellulales bacterium]|nr:hypothetical protein [Pirellulales bacterium]
MSTMSAHAATDRPTHDPSHNRSHSHPDVAAFSSEEWRQFADDDRVALSGISLLLTAIIGMGMLGMLVVVAILAFG